MTASASFEEDVVNYAHAYERKAIFLLEMGVARNRTAFHCRCCCEVLPLHPHQPHPPTRSWLSVRALAHFLSCQGNGKHGVPTDWCLSRLHKYNNSPSWTMVKSKDYKMLLKTGGSSGLEYLALVALPSRYMQAGIKPCMKWLRAGKLSSTVVVSHQSRHLSFLRSLFFGICTITLRNT